ncbi:serine hydrolase [Pseudomonas indica]|uniref:serine hydrolase n=1 Tax=Pseudomonas indica TaxID=137658 RepID=UPI0023F9E2F2|nr:serine hydrolase [Pseudomonas indica]MBU3059194.1 class A beta-lactamase-related serine hydrolase [Pseudomonas indica]
MRKRSLLIAALPVIALLCGALVWAALRGAPEPPWVAQLQGKILRLDQRTPGDLGVYIKHLGDGGELDYQAGRHWYLASAVKVPVAIATLQRVDEGVWPLDQRLALRNEDKVDGSGSLAWQDSGSEYDLKTLLEEMLQRSDSTAADMLINRVGEDELNRRIASSMADQGFGRITSLLRVRHELYRELHPDATNLSNRDVIQLASAPLGRERVRALARTLDVDPSELRADSLEQAYQRYYARRLNAATLRAYGGMLEKLARGQLLSRANTDLLLDLMGLDEYHAYRLEAGLGKDVPFAQKTGTQFERACHMGIIDPKSEQAIVIAACVEDAGQEQAAQTLEMLGSLVSDTLLR